MARIAPFGTWVSPVTPDMATGQMLSFRELRGDGDSILWLETRPTEAGRTTLMRRDATGAITELTEAPFDVGNRVHEYGGGAYLVGKNRVVFSNRPDGALWLIEPDTAPRLIAKIPGCRYADFSFGVEDKYIFAVREDSRLDKAQPKATIVAIDLTEGLLPETNEGRILVQGPDFLSCPRLSPDGRKLAWMCWSHPDMPWDASKLMLAPIDCINFAGIIIGKPQQLAGKMRESILQPSWSPAGVLHFCTDRSGWWNVYRYVEEASRICPVRAEIGSPHWVFGQRYYDFLSESTLVAMSYQEGTAEAVRIRQGVSEKLPFGQIAEAPIPLPENSFAYIANPADAPPSIVISGQGRNIIVRSAGETGLKKEDISVGRSVLFPLSTGLTGHAVWYAPTNSAFEGPDGELPPLVVMCHGGPTGMTGTGFSLKVQWWTSRGFAVLDVNYGGSSGFGRIYRERLYLNWGVVDVSDCIAAATYMADAAYVDKRRMMIRGSSAGGLTVLSVLTSSDLFRAGASIYGVTDLTLLAKETHKFESHYLDWLIAPPPKAETLYKNRSPITQVGRLRSPVIFFQGLDDKIVPPNQARTMATTIRKHGIEAPLHEFEGEGHGFRKPETQKAVLVLETEFYGKVLGFKPTI